MNLRPFSPEIELMFSYVFSCRQCYKKETLQNDMVRHGKTHLVAVPLQQIDDADQRQCKAWMQPCIKNDHQNHSKYGEYLHAPQVRNDEEIQRGYGGRIPPEAGSEKRAGEGAYY